uniref:Uncharacterized protein n=1 Tax=Caenorhabditis japonica TaxID=281687 RepID=A0A8R1EAL8_CAEJA
MISLNSTHIFYDDDDDDDVDDEGEDDDDDENDAWCAREEELCDDEQNTTAPNFPSIIKYLNDDNNDVVNSNSRTNGSIHKTGKKGRKQQNMEGKFG